MIRPLSTKERQAVRKLMVRSTNWIGDAVMTTPALRTIRENFPQAEISLLALPWVADVFRHSPRIDRIIPYERKGRHRGITGMLRLSGELRREHFDGAILLQNAFAAAFITRCAGIPLRAGYTTDGRGLLLSHGVGKASGVEGRHQVYYYQEMLAGLGLARGPDRLELFLGNDDLASAKARMAHGERIFTTTIGLNPGAAYGPAKRWPAARYADLAARLCRDQATRILVFGTQADNGAAREIGATVRDPDQLLDLTGKTTLGEAMALISRCQCFISNDSGLMHVAAALHVPMVALFGSTNPVTTPPFSDQARIVRIGITCSPCMRTHCPKGHFRCMEDLSVEMVLEAVYRRLEETR